MKRNSNHVGTDKTQKTNRKSVYTRERDRKSKKYDGNEVERGKELNSHKFR